MALGLLLDFSRDWTIIHRITILPEHHIMSWLLADLQSYEAWHELVHNCVAGHSSYRAKWTSWCTAHGAAHREDFPSPASFRTGPVLRGSSAATVHLPVASAYHAEPSINQPESSLLLSRDFPQGHASGWATQGSVAGMETMCIWATSSFTFFSLLRGSAQAWWCITHVHSPNIYSRRAGYPGELSVPV